MHRKPLFAVVAFLALLAGTPAGAQDRAWNWAGLYLGGHVGGLTGTTTFANPEGSSIYGDSVMTPGFLAGVQIGYNWMASPQWLVGLQADGSVLSSQGHNTCFQSSITTIGSDCKAFPDALATLVGRLGYVPEPGGRTMVYGRAGVAWMRSRLSVNPNDNNMQGFALTGDTVVEGEPVTQTSSAWGWTIGAGFEYALTSA